MISPRENSCIFLRYKQTKTHKRNMFVQKFCFILLSCGSLRNVDEQKCCRHVRMLVLMRFLHQRLEFVNILFKQKTLQKFSIIALILLQIESRGKSSIFCFIHEKNSQIFQQLTEIIANFNY